MFDFVSWNLSKAGRRMMQADAFFISFPKSGRTWVRVFYFSYLAKLAGKELSFVPADFPGFPQLFFTHDRWEHRRSPGFWGFVRGRYLVPPAARREKKIVLLVRDPRDVVVSLYFHLTKRPQVYRWKPGSLGEILRNPEFGISQVIELFNGWLAEWHGRPNFKLMRYEDCRAEPAREFRGLLEFLGITPVDETAFAHALEVSRFENMQAAEASGKSKKANLSAGDLNDRESFKARRGKVEGFYDFLNADELAFAAEQMKKLDARFGWRKA
jgi:hypothetical protein